MIKCDILIIAYDHSLPIATLLKDSALLHGYSSEIVSPDRCSVDIKTRGSAPLIDGQVFRAKIIMTRGIHHVFPFFATWLKLAEDRSFHIFNGIYPMYVALDKLATLAVLSEKHIEVVPAVSSIAPLTSLPYFGENLIKPAFGSRGAGVERATLEHIAEVFKKANNKLSPILEHQIIQPLVSPFGVDYRSVVLDGKEIAQTKRTAPTGVIATNGHEALIERSELLDVRELAERATEAIGLKLAGVDIIYFEGSPAILEVNCWPGMAETSKVSGVNIAEHIIRSCESLLNR